MGAAIRPLFLALLVLAACDTRAQPTAASAGPAVPPDRASREHETCGTTAHCAEGLRCFESTCRRADRSILGDYHAALGAIALAQGDAEAALSAYGEALKRYDVEKLVAPLDIECAYGNALAGARADKDRAELAARVLHRCVAAAPPGSALRREALRSAALLDEAGLDPEHLLREQPADVYLSRSPAKPSTEKLAVSVAATPVPTAKSWPAMVEAITAQRPALIACWERNYAGRREPVLAVAVPMWSDYKPSDYDDEPGTWTTGVDPKAPPPATDVEKCVRDAVNAAGKAVKGGGEWTATVNVRVQ